MPDFGDLYYTTYSSSEETFIAWFFLFIFIWCFVGYIFDKITEYKWKKEKKQKKNIV